MPVFEQCSLLTHQDRKWEIDARREEEVMQMLWTIVGVLVVLWLLGFGFNIGGGLIHLLLVIAVIVLVIQLVTGRRVV